MIDSAQPLGTCLAAGPPRHRPAPVPLLGRSREMATLRRVLHEAGQGVGTAALVQGEAGIGKTRLLAEIVAHADEQGFQVLSARPTSWRRTARSGR